MSKEIKIALSDGPAETVEFLAKEMDCTKEHIIKEAITLLESCVKAQKEGKMLAFTMPEDKMDLYINNLKICGEIKL